MSTVRKITARSHPIAGERLDVAQLGVGRLALAALGEAGLERMDHVLRGARERDPEIAVEQDQVAFTDQRAAVAHAAHHRDAHRPRHNHHVRGERPFLHDHALEAAAVVFEQFRRTQVAGDQDGVVAQALRSGGAELARDDPQQPVRQVLEIVHAVG
jgi:hypothetical protein